MTDNADLKEDIHSTFIKHSKGELKNKCKLRPTEYDCATFEKLMSDDTFNENNFSEQEKFSAMYNNYLFFRKKISDSDKTHTQLHDAIYQLKIVSIMLQNENPQEIFESLNSTGLDLSKADLIRNFLLMPLTYDCQEDFYKNYWLKIEELLRQSDNVENFIVQYLIAKLKTNDAYGKKVATKMLYDMFKLYFDDKCNDVESCFKDMFRYAKFFRRLIFNDETKFENLPALDKKFYELMYLLDANNAPIILMYLLDRNEREPLEIKISNWINLVREVVRQFYAFDEDIFRQAAQNENLPRKGKLFSAESQTLQKPFKIAENYYMENRLSTGECLKMVKILAENFDKLGGTNFKEEIYFTLRRI